MSFSSEVERKKRGRGSWAQGKIMEFLLAHKEQFWATDGLKAERGEFYDRVTNLWYQNFGPNQVYNEAPPENIELSFDLKPEFVDSRGFGEYSKNWVTMRDVRSFLLLCVQIKSANLITCLPVYLSW